MNDLLKTWTYDHPKDFTPSGVFFICFFFLAHVGIEHFQRRPLNAFLSDHLSGLLMLKKRPSCLSFFV